VLLSDPRMSLVSIANFGRISKRPILPATTKNGHGAPELRELCDVLIRAARAADGWRRVGV